MREYIFNVPGVSDEMFLTVKYYLAQYWRFKAIVNGSVSDAPPEEIQRAERSVKTIETLLNGITLKYGSDVANMLRESFKVNVRVSDIAGIEDKRPQFMHARVDCYRIFADFITFGSPVNL